MDVEIDLTEKDYTFEDEMRAEGEMMKREERIERNTVHIPVKHELGEGVEELVRDRLTTDKIRFVWIPF